MLILIKQPFGHLISAGILAFIFSFQLTAQTMQTNDFDWQGHRGARGLVPENTIPAFLKALEYRKITTLELDLAVSKDGVLIVSHEPWMSALICNRPDGTPVGKEEEKSLNIFGLTYEEIKTYDCGSRGNARFPEQEAMKTYKPSLADVVEEVRAYCSIYERPLPAYNIEIKSSPEMDGIFTPPVGVFARQVVDEIKHLGIKDRATIQSFDIRALQALHHYDPSITTALLVENSDSPQENLDRLGYLPAIYSPYYKLLKKRHIKALHEQGIKVIPWTVNKKKTMKKLIRKGVDGLITDYPNLAFDVEDEQ